MINILRYIVKVLMGVTKGIAWCPKVSFCDSLKKNVSRKENNFKKVNSKWHKQEIYERER